MSLPPPPVPAKLREMLKDYPGHIKRLQEVLVQSVDRSRRLPLMPFDDAISALEGRLETFIFEARDELKMAEASGVSLAIAKAKEKERLMEFSRSSNIGMADLDELWEYIQASVWDSNDLSS